MEAFNEAMSSVRVSVEWLFGDIVDYFKFLDFKRNLEIGMSSIGKLYPAFVWLEFFTALIKDILRCSSPSVHTMKMSSINLRLQTKGL